jgi:NTE family protein
MHRPDILVLGAGGARGAAWISGALAGIAEVTGIDFTTTEQIVGTSAGAMVGADLLAGEAPRAPAPDTDGPPAEPAAPIPDEDATLLAAASRFGTTVANVAARPLAPLALAAARPGGALLRAAALARIEAPERSLDDLHARIASHGLRFDGRLRVCCVERESGRRVVFGAPGAPPATVAEAVQASCSVPWRYRPVRIGEREYVDGALWSPTNLDAAPAMRETHVLCLAPTGGMLGPRTRHPALQAAATASIALETLTVRRRGAILDVLAPDGAATVEDPRRAGYRQGMAFARER